MDILQWYENLLFKYFQYDEKLIEIIQLLGSQAAYSKEDIRYLETIRKAYETIQQNSEIYSNQSLDIPWWEYPYRDIENRILNQQQFDILDLDIKDLLVSSFEQYALYDREFFYLILGSDDVGVDFMGKMFLFLLKLENQHGKLMKDSCLNEKIISRLEYKINHETIEQLLAVMKLLRGNESRYVPLIRKLYIKMFLLKGSEELYVEHLKAKIEDVIAIPIDEVEKFIIEDFEKQLICMENRDLYYYEKGEIEKNYVSYCGSWYPLWLFGIKLSKQARELEQEMQTWAEEYDYEDLCSDTSLGKFLRVERRAYERSV